MRNSRVLLVVLGLICFVGCLRRHRHGGYSESISISDNRDVYKFTAKYNKHKTGKVRSYLKEALSPSELFEPGDNYINMHTTLTDNTELYIKSSAGQLQIKLDKDENSRSSYRRIKKVCEGLKEVLK